MRILETHKFIDNSISIRTFLPFQRDKVTYYNLCALMMKLKTEKYPSKKEILLRLNQAYNFRFSIRIQTIGESFVLEFRFQFIRSQYLPCPIDPLVLTEMMDQFLFHTRIDPESFHESVHLLRNKLIRQYDDPDTIAYTKALSLLDPLHPVTLRPEGYLEDLDHISYERIPEILEQIHQAPRFVMACGDFAPSMVSYLSGLDTCPKNWDCLLPYLSSGYQKEVILKQIEQTSLVLCCKTGIGLKDTQADSLIVMTSILGQCPNNLLFETIREQNSLCYSIHSSLIRSCGLLLVHAGTSAQNVEGLLALVDEQIKRLQNGDFTTALLENAKRDLIDSLDMVQDYPFAWLDQVFFNEYIEHKKSMDEKKRSFQNITKEDVVAVSKTLTKCSLAIIKEEPDESI